MRLTPLDIRKQEFKKAMRGLDGDEVYAFLSTVADEYEAVLNDNKSLRERLLELDDKVQEYRNMEKTLRDTLLTAERVTEEAKDNARREADLIIRQAELEADRGVRSINDNAARLRQEIQLLKRQRDSYVSRMKVLVESHMKFVEGAETDFAQEEKSIEQEHQHWMRSHPGSGHGDERRSASVSPQDSRTADGVAPAMPGPHEDKRAEPGAHDSTTSLAEEPVIGEASRVTAPAGNPTSPPASPATSPPDVASSAPRATLTDAEQSPPNGSAAPYANASQDPLTPPPSAPETFPQSTVSHEGPTSGGTVAGATDRLNALLESMNNTSSATAVAENVPAAAPPPAPRPVTAPEPALPSTAELSDPPATDPYPPPTTRVAQGEPAATKVETAPAAVESRRETAPAEPRDDSGGWSLDRLKRDILGRRGANEDD